jgi:hypothetical protein
MYRTHHCGELRIEHVGQEVTLSGWVQKSRDKGFMMWIDLRDRYGITQLIFSEEKSDAALFERARELGREFVVQVKGSVIERSSKNPNLPTGDIEIEVSELAVLNPAKLPPFTIEDETDGGDDLRMKYRYLDLPQKSGTKEYRFPLPTGTGSTQIPQWGEFCGSGNPLPDQKHAGRRPRLCRAQPDEPRAVLRPSAITPNLQADPDGIRP